MYKKISDFEFAFFLHIYHDLSTILNDFNLFFQQKCIDLSKIDERILIARTQLINLMDGSGAFESTFMDNFDANTSKFKTI